MSIYTNSGDSGLNSLNLLTFSSTYELNFMQAKPVRGFYKLTVSAKPSKEDKKLLGLTGAEVRSFSFRF
jgi:hypothetical protein